MDLTEDMFRYISDSISLHLNESIDFNRPFKKVDMIPELMKYFKTNIDLRSPNLHSELYKMATNYSIIKQSENANYTTNQILEKLVKHAIESNIKEPTFVINYPKIISPLALPSQ